VSESTEMEMACCCCCSSARAESRRGKEAAGDGVSAMAEGRRPAGVRMVALACCSATARPARRRVSVYYHHRGEHDEPGSGSGSGFIDRRRRVSNTRRIQD
jgi:hypothetical protein